MHSLNKTMVSTCLIRMIRSDQRVTVFPGKGAVVIGSAMAKGSSRPFVPGRPYQLSTWPFKSRQIRETQSHIALARELPRLVSTRQDGRLFWAFGKFLAKGFSVSFITSPEPRDLRCTESCA